MGNIVHAKDFSDLLNSSFELSGEGIEGKIQAELIEVKELPHEPAPTSERKPFSLQFRLPQEQQLWQGVYSVNHPSLEESALLLVPIGTDDEGWYLEACFN